MYVQQPKCETECNNTKILKTTTEFIESEEEGSSNSNNNDNKNNNNNNNVNNMNILISSKLIVTIIIIIINISNIDVYSNRMNASATNRRKKTNSNYEPITIETTILNLRPRITEHTVDGQNPALPIIRNIPKFP